MEIKFDLSRTALDVGIGIGVAFGASVVLLFLLFVLTPIAMSICDRMSPPRRPMVFTWFVLVMLAPYSFSGVFPIMFGL